MGMDDDFDWHSVQVAEVFGPQDRWESEGLGRFRVNVRWIGTVDDLIRGLQIAAEGMVDATVDIEDRQAFSGLPILYVDGYKPGGEMVMAEWARQQEDAKAHRCEQYEKLRAEFDPS